MEPMNNPGFRPNRQRYLVLPTEIKGQETKIEGSQYSIESAKDPHAKPSEGTVVAVGKECIEFQPGDTVLYGKYSGYPQEFDGREYIILAESEILGERLITPFDEPVAPLPGQTIRVIDFPSRAHNVVGNCARIIREYVEPASEWSGKPETKMVVAVNPSWTQPLHLQPHQFEYLPEEEVSGRLS